MHILQGAPAGQRARVPRLRRLLARGGEAARCVVDSLLGSYAQILFSESRLVGAVLLLSTATVPALFAGGAAAVLLAAGLVLLLGFDRCGLRAGLYGYNALLLGLGSASLLRPGLPALALAAVAVLFSVLVTVMLQRVFNRGLNLPVLTLPFLASYYLLLGAARVLLLERLPAASPAPWLQAWIPWPEAVLYLRSLGAIFFMPRVDSGLLFLLALALYSRLALALSLLGFGFALGLLRLVDVAWDGILPIVVGFNFILVAVAVGRVWFPAGPTSLALALAALLVSALLTLGLLPVMVRVGLPLLILPFNITVLCLLYVMHFARPGLTPTLSRPDPGQRQGARS